MPFETGMDKFLKTFEPVDMQTRLLLKAPKNNLKKTRADVASWYEMASALEKVKPMKTEIPRAKAIAKDVSKRVNYAKGNYYSGDFLHGKRHGQGEYLSKSKGFLYRGEWKNDKIHGPGTTFDRKPDKTWFLSYTGNYKNGLRDGWGTYRWSDQEFYEGYWVKNRREGRGRHYAPDGTVYEGQWLDDRRRGYGVTKEGTGNHHLGEYDADMKNGPGKYNFVRTGKCLRGIWQDDIPVLGDLIQLNYYKPTFPHQYPLPELGLKDPTTVLEDSAKEFAPDFSLKDTLRTGPKASAEENGLPQNDRETGTESAGGRQERRLSVKNEVCKMQRFLDDIEPHVAEVTDAALAVEAANYFVVLEYLWRSTPQ